MHIFYDEAEEKARHRYTDEPAIEDDIEELRAELDVFLSNLIGYRAHLVHKATEEDFDRDFYSQIKKCIEAMIICDWKMKILSSKYREAQQDWFTKRGSSLLGFEVHLKFEDSSTEVLYHFFISDDTLQDSEAVLCAKHYLYTKVLPMYGVKHVHFRSDGAGCFSSKEAKSSMVFFAALAERLEGAYEISNKVSVAGCGKTALDVSTIFVIQLYAFNLFIL